VPSYLTQDAFEKLKQELEDRKTKLRREIAEMIRDAKDFGDLSENAAYKDARDQESFNESRIQYLEELLRDTTIVEKQKGATVQLGSTFRVKFNGQEREFQVVDSQEANPQGGKISINSPIGKAVVGAKVGERVSVETPTGKVSYSITSIT